MQVVESTVIQKWHGTGLFLEWQDDTTALFLTAQQLDDRENCVHCI